VYFLYAEQAPLYKSESELQRSRKGIQTEQPKSMPCQNKEQARNTWKISISNDLHRFSLEPSSMAVCRRKGGKMAATTVPSLAQFL
jgi:hypothetical protein